MADTLSRIYTGTGLTYAQLSTGVTLFTNSSNQTRVIKNIDISNPCNRHLRFTVGGRHVGTATSTDSLTGTEIVNPSESLVVSTPSRPVFSLSHLAGSTTEIAAISNINFSAEPHKTVENSYRINTASGTAYPITTYWAIRGVDGKYYSTYGLGGNNIYRRNTAFAADTALSGVSNVFAPFYDPDDQKIYYGNAADTTIRWYDTVNNTTGSVTANGNWTASAFNFLGGIGPSIATLDGFAYVRPNYNPQGYLVNLSTGDANPVPSTAGNGSYLYPVFFLKALDGSYVVGATGNLRGEYKYHWWNIGVNLSAPTVTKYGTSDSAAPFNTYAHIFRVPNDKSTAFQPSVSLNQPIITAMDGTLRAYSQSATNPTTNNNSYYYNSFWETEPTRAALQFGTVDITVTAITTDA